MFILSRRLPAAYFFSISLRLFFRYLLLTSKTSALLSITTSLAIRVYQLIKPHSLSFHYLRRPGSSTTLRVDAKLPPTQIPNLRADS